MALAATVGLIIRKDEGPNMCRNFKMILHSQTNPTRDVRCHHSMCVIYCGSSPCLGIWKMPNCKIEIAKDLFTYRNVLVSRSHFSQHFILVQNGATEQASGFTRYNKKTFGFVNISRSVNHCNHHIKIPISSNCK